MPPILFLYFPLILRHLSLNLQKDSSRYHISIKSSTILTQKSAVCPTVRRSIVRINFRYSDYPAGPSASCCFGERKIAPDSRPPNYRTFPYGRLRLVTSTESLRIQIQSDTGRDSIQRGSSSLPLSTSLAGFSTAMPKYTGPRCTSYDYSNKYLSRLRGTERGNLNAPLRAARINFPNGGEAVVINRNESALEDLSGRDTSGRASDRGGRKLLHTSAGDVSPGRVLLLIKRLTDRHQPARRIPSRPFFPIRHHLSLLPSRRTLGAPFFFF